MAVPKQRRPSLWALLLGLAVTTTHAFSVPHTSLTQQTLHTLRGGQDPTRLTATMLPLQSLLETGPYGVVALTSMAASICIPATQIKNLYGISVGYGLSVAAIGLYLMQVFGSSSILCASVFYGVRLAVHLLVRDVSGYKSLSTDQEPPRLKRLPFALSLSLFYACLCTPLLYGCRVVDSGATWKSQLFQVGTVLAWTGAILEAVADLHKFVSKIQNKDVSDFTGPVNGVYRLTRHPNYTGEIMFWLGVLLSGVPSLGRSIVGWLFSVLGFTGIFNIMKSASHKLEEKQEETYGGQELYDDWKKKSPFPVIPFVKG